MLKVILTHGGFDLDTNLNDIGLREWRDPYKQLYHNHGWKYEKASSLITYKGKIYDYFIEKYNKFPDFILFFENHEKYLLLKDELKCKTGMIINDIHHSSNISKIRTVIYGSLDIIFATCKNCFSDFYPTIDINKVVWYPHTTSDDFIVPFNNNPIEKIILSGVISNMQHLRCELYKLRKKFPIDILRHPSYRAKDYSNKIVGNRYIQKLNEYLVGFSTEPTKETKRRYLVNKSIEIPAAGCLLLLGIETDKFKNEIEELGFIDGETYISTTKDNMIDKLKYILDPINRTKIDEIRLNGYNLVLQKHLISHRAKLIDDSVNELLVKNK